MSVEKFYKDTFILTVSNIFTGILGFIFTIILSRRLGTEGLGLYGLITPIYGLLLCLVADGLVTAISKTSAVYFGKKDYKNLRRTVSTTFSFILFYSFTIAFIVLINSSFISRYIIKDARSSLALAILCPAIVFVPLSAIMKGYYYGTGKFKIAAAIDIFEKFIRVLVFISITGVLALQSIKSNVSAAFCALTIGEAISFSLLYFFFKRLNRQSVVTVSRIQSRPQLLVNVLKISLPLCLSGIVTSILAACTALILPRRLMHAGFQYHTALSLIGKFNGMSLTITCLPLIIIGSLSTVLVPDLSVSLSSKKYADTEKRISQVFKIALLTGVSSFIIIQSMPDILGRLFYNRPDLGGYISFASISTFLVFISSPTYGILNGLGKQKTLLRNSILTSVLELVSTYILAGIPSVNIYAVGITIIISSIVSIILNTYEIRKLCPIKMPVKEVVSCFASGILIYLTLKTIGKWLPDSLMIFKGMIIGGVGLTLILYFNGLLNRITSQIFKKSAH